MTLQVAIQMDAIETIDINGDSTFVLALEAQKRGHALFHYLPENLTYDQGRIVALARPLEVRRQAGNHFTLGDAQLLDLGRETDVVLMRQDPPFDMAYITATHLLEMVHGTGPDQTFVVNNPAEVRNAPEKLFVTGFPDLMPPTMITRDEGRVKAFRQQHGDIIIKPLYGNGGAGVFHLKPDDTNLNSLLEMFFTASREPVIAQAYLPAVRAGDKRIILIDGRPAGAVNRVPAKDETRSNLHVGGAAKKVSLTDRELEICTRIGPVLKEKGLIFVGIDVIGDVLTEINVTSPTGLQEINRFDGTCLEAEIWDAIESKTGE